MKLKWLFLLFVLISSTVKSQVNQNLLKVKGESVLYSTPENLVFNMPISVTDTVFEDCSRKLVDQYNKVRDVLIKCGIKKDIITVAGVNVSSKYERNEDGKSVFAGYAGSTNIMTEMKFDPVILNRLINAMRNKNVNQVFNFEFQLSKEQKDSLSKLSIQNAVADAQKKATILSKNLGVNLIEVVEVVYGSVSGMYDELISEDETYLSQEEVGGSVSMQLNPQKISITKNVSIVWKIGK